MKQHTPYVYRLTDKITLRRYIGSRYARNCDPSDLGVTYFTSSKIVRKLFKSDPERFEKQIITTGNCDYVLRVEKFLIDAYDAVASEDFYNRTNNRAIHPDDSRKGGLAMAARTSARMIENHPMREPEKAAKHSEWMKLNNPAKRFEIRNAMSEARKGKPKSEAHKIKIKNSGCGQKGAALNFTTRWKCVDCGFSSVNGVVSQHLNRTKHSGKIKLEK